MTEPKKLQFKPYARLLTMLGEQLIKNERIALVEVIKNSYDADASWVTIDFQGFDENFGATSKAKIVIEDDGLGMTRDLIEKHWVNPATPSKLIRKKSKPKTAKGRVIQGEKGIGRFALLKLGAKIEFITRAEGEPCEQRLVLDLSGHDADFIASDGRALFLDDLHLTVEEIHVPQTIIPKNVTIGNLEIERAAHGTRIEISNLSSTWSPSKIEKVYSDVLRLRSIFDPRIFEAEPLDLVNSAPQTQADQFDVWISRNGDLQALSDDPTPRLANLARENSVFAIAKGEYDQAAQEYRFDLNGSSRTISLHAPEIKGLQVFREYFGKEGERLKQKTECGDFDFSFYVFDFSADATGKYLLDDSDKALIKSHRIYLYRDGIRVYPYGDPEDDWLGIDIYRGTKRASAFLSNDQVIGHVAITQQHNPDLRDKTNREGLVDVGKANEDFLAVLRVFLAWLRNKPYAEYRARTKKSVDVDIFKKNKVQEALEGAQQASDGAPQAREQLAEAKRLYQAERTYLVRRAEATEHLAGIGLSVETASHDLMSAMNRASQLLNTLIKQAMREGEINKEALGRDLTAVRGLLNFISDQIKDIQLLFRSTKQRRKDIRVREVLEKVQRLFEEALRADGIELIVEETTKPLVAKTTDAVLLQLFLNLFDNSVYWLKTVSSARRIRIALDGEEGTLIFSDSGPGISKTDAPYVFEPFYSGKGEDGRGLGLYIARQLLERHEYTIDLADLKAQRLEQGASFVISFVKGE